MNAVSGRMGEGGAGVPRADMVLGDRDGTRCAPEFTAFVRSTLADMGYEVKVNDPFNGVELVRAYADPAAGRHSLQLEVTSACTWTVPGCNGMPAMPACKPT